MTSRDFQDRLARRARRVGVTVAPAVGERLETYFRLLATWNRKINLTGANLDEPTPEALDRLLVEPMVAARHVTLASPRIIDIGSGGGSPAIPFAVSLVGSHLVMVESKTRKSVFLREVVRALEIATAEVESARFEELLSRPNLHERMDVLTVRAVRTEIKVLMSLQAFVRPGGCLFLFRGSTTTEPASTLTPPLVWRATFPLLENLRSRLVILEKRSLDGDVPRGTSGRRTAEH